jgi:hypothetical protein
VPSTVGGDFVQWTGDPSSTGRWPIRLVDLSVWGLVSLLPLMSVLAAHERMHRLLVLVLLCWSAAGIIGVIATLDGDRFQLHAIRMDAAGLQIEFSRTPMLASTTQASRRFVPWAEVRSIEVGLARLDDSWSPAYFLRAELEVPLGRRRTLELGAYGPDEWVERGRELAAAGMTRSPLLHGQDLTSTSCRHPTAPRHRPSG